MLAVVVAGGLDPFDLLISIREPSATAPGLPTSMIGKPSGQQIRICASPDCFADTPSNKRFSLVPHAGSAALVCESLRHLRPKLGYCRTMPDFLHRQVATAAFAPLRPDSPQSIKRRSFWTSAVSSRVWSP